MCSVCPDDLSHIHIHLNHVQYCWVCGWGANFIWWRTDLKGWRYLCLSCGAAASLLIPFDARPLYLTEEEADTYALNLQTDPAFYPPRLEGLKELVVGRTIDAEVYIRLCHIYGLDPAIPDLLKMGD